MNLESRASIIEIEQPTLLYGYCSLNTASVIFGIYTIILNVLGLTVETWTAQSVLIYGECGYICIGFLGIFAGVAFLGVGLTDNPVFSQIACGLLYVMAFIFFGILVWLIFAINDETKFHGTAFEKFHRDLFAKLREQNTRETWFEYMTFEDHLALMMKSHIFSMLMTAMFSVYLARKYGENPEYLKKKAV